MYQCMSKLHAIKSFPPVNSALVALEISPPHTSGASPPAPEGPCHDPPAAIGCRPTLVSVPVSKRYC